MELPNIIPLDAATVAAIAHRVEGYRFDRVDSGWWGRAVVQDGPAPSTARRSATSTHLNGPQP
ncbi:MAG: hypothetical protein DLM60_09210 [Pseudonocardiales bacterium]|nr:MAG: hypothetical protein DLM60_09210 [Pseudonocardiales bacterium]